MPREAEFNFVPLNRKKKLEIEKYVNIGKNGTMIIPKHTLNALLGSETKQFFIKLYYDIEKRALGFSFPNKTYPGDDSIRVVKPFQSKQGSIYATVGIRPFVRSLDVAAFPAKRLKINKYKNGYLGVEIYYVIVPKHKNQKKENDEI